jgi:uncharacterized MnhB-related membrane protein
MVTIIIISQSLYLIIERNYIEPIIAVNAGGSCIIEGSNMENLTNIAFS